MEEGQGEGRGLPSCTHKLESPSPPPQTCRHRRDRQLEADTNLSACVNCHCPCTHSSMCSVVESENRISLQVVLACEYKMQTSLKWDSEWSAEVLILNPALLATFSPA